MTDQPPTNNTDELDEILKTPILTSSAKFTKYGLSLFKTNLRRYTQQMVLNELKDIYEACCTAVPVPNCLDMVADRITTIEKEMEKL